LANILLEFSHVKQIETKPAIVDSSGSC